MNNQISNTPFVDKIAYSEQNSEPFVVLRSDAAKLERLLNRIAFGVDTLSDSPLSLLATMQEFSKNWKTDRENYLG